MRAGVSPSCVALPRMKNPPWPTLLDYLAERLPAVPRHEWLARLQAGEVVGDNGLPLPSNVSYQNGLRVYYWRSLPQEPEIPFQAVVIHQDEHLVVADKPHFLPVTPGGRYVQQTLLVRLKQLLQLPNLSPLHRIDRETAGLVVFSVRPQDRNDYQRLFRERRVHKTYEAIAGLREDLTWPRIHRSHLLEDENAFYRMREAAPQEQRPINSETHIQLLETHGGWGRYRLEPISGKRHQLRVHMNALGLPLVGDQFYPNVLRQPGEWEDFSTTLGLLARSIAFTDPVTGQARYYESSLTLPWPSPPELKR
jgi:tRNA pseudouridine32 synthase / 23S rRNA pseudouridine746 synthase